MKVPSSPDPESREPEQTRDLALENRQFRARLETLGMLVSRVIDFDDQRANEISPQLTPLEYVFDAECDTAFSHPHHSFAFTLHIAHFECSITRAAVGRLPGGKLTIHAEGPLSTISLDEILTRIASKRYDRFVLHGYSDNMEYLARHIARVYGAKLYCVWHENFSLLRNGDQSGPFESWFRLQESGLVARAHIQNANEFLPNGYHRLLPKLPPNWRDNRIALPFEVTEASVALLPSCSDVWRNWHTNLLAAEQTSSIRRILYYADIRSLFPVNKPCDRVLYDPNTHLEVVASADIVFDTTLSDDHAPGFLEGLACGTPSVAGRQFAGERNHWHSYERLCQVDNPRDVQAIVQAATKIATVPPKELSTMMSEYYSMLIKEGITRYAEFLDI